MAMTHDRERANSARMADVHVKIPPDLLADIRALAASEDRTINAEIRRAIRQYVEATHRQTTLGVIRAKQERG